MATKGSIQVNRETLMTAVIGVRNAAVNITTQATQIKSKCNNAEDVMSGGDADNIIEHFKTLGQSVSNIKSDFAALSTKLNAAADLVEDLDKRKASASADDAVNTTLKNSRLKKQ